VNHLRKYHYRCHFASLLSAVLWWDTGAITDAQVRKAQLQAEVAQMQANHDSWVQAGMLGKIIRCPGIGDATNTSTRLSDVMRAVKAGVSFIKLLCQSGANWIPT
jgi:hypothetical protein